MDLKWAKMVQEGLKTVKKNLRSIYDAVAAAAPGGTNILVEGNVPGFKFIDQRKYKNHAFIFVTVSWTEKKSALYIQIIEKNLIPIYVFPESY